jgi:hypothetical protein
MTTHHGGRKPGFSRSPTIIFLSIAVLCWVAPLTAQTFTPFSAPDAGTGNQQGTAGIAINPGGVITGYYIDGNNGHHGFVRSASGVLTEFDPPHLTETFSGAINRGGQIVGDGLHDETHFGIYYGFLRSANGDISPLSVSGAFETFPAAINDSGEIAGTANISPGVWHGFLATISGGRQKYALFEEPNAAKTIPGRGTFASGINANGEVVGYYDDASLGVFHGYVRDHNGNFTSFDAPGAGTIVSSGTFALAINRSGEVAGYYTDNNYVAHGFIRDAAGNITDFDPPGATYTYAASINDAGEIVGQWSNSASLVSGFVRSASGVITSYTAPVPNNGTYLYSVNDAGRMTGFYSDLNGAFHGFVQ